MVVMVLPSVVMVLTRAEVVTAEEVLPDDCWAPDAPLEAPLEAPPATPPTMGTTE